MQRIANAYLQLLNALKAAAGAIIFAVFLLIVSDVLIRTAGFKPWQASSVLVEYGLLWFTMLAAPWLARHKAHVFIDAITQLLPAEARKRRTATDEELARTYPHGKPAETDETTRRPGAD